MYKMKYAKKLSLRKVYFNTYISKIIVKIPYILINILDSLSIK